MENPRWWHIAVTSMAVVLTVMVITADVPVWRQVGAQAALMVFVVGWFTIGRLAFQSVTAAWVFSGIVIVSVGVAVGFQPYMAIIQCVAYPLLWVISTSLRGAILANVALAASVGVGFWFSTADIVQTLLTSVLSLGLSVALGLWITQIAERSHERQRLLDELRSTQDRLAAVSRDAGVASERERLAREIHDTIAQDLTGLVLLEIGRAHV